MLQRQQEQHLARTLRTVHPVRNSNRETHAASTWSGDCARKTHKASTAGLAGGFQVNLQHKQRADTLGKWCDRSPVSHQMTQDTQNTDHKHILITLSKKMQGTRGLGVNVEIFKIEVFCKDTFDKNYKATIGVDFEMERFEVLGVPFSLQLWDTAGQERFKCIASTYYRGAQAIVIVFDVNDVGSLEHTRQWLADALKENDPSNVILFLVGSKKDLSTPAQYSLMEKDALKVAQEMQAEYWAVSSLTGENVRDFFFRVAALTFESSVLAELERGSGARRIGDTVRISSKESDLYLSTSRKKPKCCQ
uniref:Ras-related protein Rab-36 n=1 Tax=Serinus canaria TaxID=9135 RepID=A0A8C9UC54_SERCA